MRLHSRSALLCHEYLHKTYAPSRFSFEGVIHENELAVELKRLGIEHEELVIQHLLSISDLKILDLRNQFRREEDPFLARRFNNSQAHNLTSPLISFPQIDYLSSFIRTCPIRLPYFFRTLKYPLILGNFHLSRENFASP